MQANKIFFAVEHVAEYVDGIVVCDGVVPTIDESSVHFVERCKRSVIKCDNILVTVMPVSDVINHILTSFLDFSPLYFVKDIFYEVGRILIYGSPMWFRVALDGDNRKKN